MSILGHGIDVVNVKKIQQLLNDAKGNFLNRCFTSNEIEQSNSIESFAGKFAAKEAVLKALGIGFDDGISFKDIEIETLPSGAPYIKLYRNVAQLAQDIGISNWHISISHTEAVGVASVIAS